MNLAEAFSEQLTRTRPITAEDLQEEDGGAVVWNGVVICPDGNTYSSGKEMKPGDKLLVAYLVTDANQPVNILLEEREIGNYDGIFRVIRVVDRIPVVSYRDASRDRYAVEEPNWCR